LVNIDKNQLSAYYGENWEEIERAMETLTRARFWELLRIQNIQPILDSMGAEDVEGLARDIIERRVENRVLLTLEHAFAP
jgi:hypothetical protein